MHAYVHTYIHTYIHTHKDTTVYIRTTGAEYPSLPETAVVLDYVYPVPLTAGQQGPADTPHL
jgi:hypothetical protein